ncbi:LacI family transcriptional regulator [bacterium]|nr:LacI family transcriptional regulator [bacterium]
MIKKPKNNKTTVTIKDIARLAEVSVTTVSHALSGERYVKELTRQKILKIIEETKYRPNIIARSLSKKVTKILGIIVPDINNPVFTQILAGIEHETAKDDYVLVLSSTYYDNAVETDQIDRLNTLYADGLIFIGGAKETKHIEKENLRNIPAVLIRRPVIDGKFHQVSIDFKKAMINAVDYLSNLGHSSIGYLGWMDEKSLISQDKYYGYLEGLAKNNLKTDKKNIILKKGKMDNPYNESLEMIKDYLKNNKIEMSAIICKNDFIALGAIDAFKTQNLKIPENISILGFGNIKQSMNSIPALSTVNEPLEEMGNSGATMLLGLINGKKFKKEPVFFDTSIVERETVKRLK